MSDFKERGDVSSLEPAQTRDPQRLLQSCLSPASFWSPEKIGPQPSWLEHAPFAFWLVEALRPRRFVELGTHGGFSYFSFCQAVKNLQLETHCYAVDTWKGDEHAGRYGEEVFQKVRDHHDPRYSAFSTLIRSTFDEALADFDDGSIDLLHIDGRHFYEDAKHDFESWCPKLSDRGVVLFHDTTVKERGFGVHRLWEELRASHLHFEFVHCNGLGVLGIGEALPYGIRALFSASESDEAVRYIREAYARLGGAVSLQMTQQRQSGQLKSHAAEMEMLRTDLRAKARNIRDLVQDLVVLRMSRDGSLNLPASVQTKAREPHPRLTIYCVAYKRYDKITILIHSLMCQTFRDFRLVVIHDGEDASMREVLKRFKAGYPDRFDFLFTEERFDDYGHSLRALGIAQCDSEFIMITNDDNYYVPSCLELMFEKVDSGSLDFVLCDMVHSHDFPGNRPQESYNAFYTEPSKQNVDIGCFIVKTELAKAAGFRDKSVAGDGTFVDDIMRNSGREVKWGKVEKILFVHN